MAVINAYVHSLVSVALEGEKARGRGGVVFIDPTLRVQYAMAEDVSKSACCGPDFVERLRQLIEGKGKLGRIVIFEITDGAASSATAWTVERDPHETKGSHYEPSLRGSFCLH